MLTPAAAENPARMRFAVLGEGLSAGLGFAALGVALYAHGPMWAAAAWYGAFGLVAGTARAWLRLRVVGQPAPLPAPLPADQLSELLRATLARAQQERAQRTGGRSPAAAPVPAPTPAAAPAAAPTAAPAAQRTTRPAELTLS